MPDFQSVDEAVGFHVENYHSDTDKKGDMWEFSANLYRRRKLLSYVPQGAFCLDIGCNTGIHARVLQLEKQCFVAGVDVIEKFVNTAREKGIYAKTGKAEELPFKDNKFEVVMASEIMEHVFNPELVTKEAHRVLQPGGIFVGSSPAETSSAEAECHKHKGNPGEGKSATDFHCHLFTKSRIRQFMKLFKDVEITGIPMEESTCYARGISITKVQWYVFKGVKP